MFSKNDVLETIAMVEKEHLDIRTITMGISLLGCIRDIAEQTSQRVYDLVKWKIRGECYACESSDPAGNVARCDPAVLRL